MAGREGATERVRHMRRLAFLAAVFLFTGAPASAAPSCGAAGGSVGAVAGVPGVLSLLRGAGGGSAGGAYGGTGAARVLMAARVPDADADADCPVATGRAGGTAQALGDEVLVAGGARGGLGGGGGAGGSGGLALDPRLVAAVAVPLILVASVAGLIVGRRRQRRAERHSLTGTVAIRGADGRPGIARFLDISCSGARLILPASAEPDARLTLSLDGAEVRARVVWCKDRVAGVAFEPALPVAVIDRVRAAPGARQSA
ncbi:hypothetical protein HKCCE2091_09750 [Rhodobacterales bacterium HKCCE2091]|nr:hypothetical protein [Rhodobacterales bacterium HKCCE2091]